ncbi:ComF family protein [Candidatus Latescibacterota bacterium]
MRAGAAATEIANSLIDFLFPPACLLCGGTFSESKFVCTDCREAVILCSYPYNPAPGILNNVDYVSILLPYDSRCRALIHSLKYHGMPSVGLFLGDLMGRKATRHLSLPEDTLIIPVPLHPARLKERGYNQSERLARGFASFSGHEIGEDILARTRETGTQTALDAEHRARNVQGAFRYSGSQSLMSRPVIIIDDVMTTGSTISECARALKEGGADKVTVCVAATPDIGDD